MAEITISHLMRLADEQGCSVSRERAVAFLNQEDAFEMWKHMMRAGEEFIANSLLRQRISPDTADCCVALQAHNATDSTAKLL